MPAFASETSLISTNAAGEPANADVTEVTISADANYALFVTAATNIIPTRTDGNTHVYRKDLTTGAVTEASVDLQGRSLYQVSERSSISYHGDYAAFNYFGDVTTPSGPAVANPELLIHEFETGLTEPVFGDFVPDDVCFQVKLSADGRYVLFCTWAREHPHQRASVCLQRLLI